MGNTVTLYTLHRAVRDEDVEAVRTLLNQEVDINAKEDGITPLHLAAKNGNEEILNLLLKSNFDVNAKDDATGFTPLHSIIANFDGKIKILNMLLDSGADVNIKTNSGDTVLHLAVEKNNASLIEYLLAFGVEVDDKNECGKTSLHVATQLNKNDSHLDTAQVLLKYGADIHAQDNNGEMAIHYLLKSKEEEVIKTSMYEIFLNYSIKSVEVMKIQKIEKSPETDPDLIMSLGKISKKSDQDIIENKQKIKSVQEKAKNCEEQKSLKSNIILTGLVMYTVMVSVILLFCFAYRSLAFAHQPPV